MTNPNDLSAVELIHLYLDGELSALLEPSLFRSLAADGDLRAEMREQLAFRSAMQRDSGYIVPPERARARALAGFDAAISHGAAPALPRTFSLTALLLTGLAASLLTVALVLLIDRPTSIATRLVPSPSVTSAAAGSARETRGAAGRPSATSGGERGDAAARDTARTNGALDAVGGGRHRDMIARSFHRAESRDAATTQALLTARNTAAPSVPPPAVVSSVPDAPVLDAGGLRLPVIEGVEEPAAPRLGGPPLPAPPLFDAALLETPSHRWTVQIRGLAGRSYPAPTLASQSEPWFRDVAVALLRDLGPDARIGVEAGQEAFAQTFVGSEGGVRVHYRQNPMLPWGGAALQLRPEGIVPYDAVRPFLQLVAGGTSVGALGRATIGLSYTPEERVSFMIGADGAALLYRIESTWYLTRKLGVTYGVSLAF